MATRLEKAGWADAARQAQRNTTPPTHARPDDAHTGAAMVNGIFNSSFDWENFADEHGQ
jgi:hypothetical protein